jgi:antitoxin ChpS
MTYEAKLRKVGGSVMLTIPPVVLDDLGLEPEMSVELEVKSGRLIVDPRGRRRYSLDDLLEETKSVRYRPKDRVWTSGRRKGRELI